MDNLRRDIVQQGNIFAADFVLGSVYDVHFRQFIWRGRESDPFPESNQLPLIAVLADCNIVVDLF